MIKEGKFIDSYKCIKLVDCLPVTNFPCIKPLTFREKAEQKKKGSTMYDLDCCDNGMDEVKLNHLAGRMSQIYITKEHDLRKQYGLMNDDPPVTAKDLIERITTGKYIVPEDRMNASTYEPTRYFTWRDPSVKKDEEGFKTAEKVLRKARTDAEDIIVVMSDETVRLKALQDFEATTIQ